MINFEQEFSTKDAARLLGLTPTRVRQLVAAGALRREPNGRFELAHLIGDWTAELKRRVEQASSQTGVQQATARYRTAQSELRELELKQKRGELLPADAVAEWEATLIHALRSAVNGRNARLAPQLEGKTVREIRRALDVDGEAIQQAFADGVERSITYSKLRAEGLSHNDAMREAKVVP